MYIYKVYILKLLTCIYVRCLYTEIWKTGIEWKSIILLSKSVFKKTNRISRLVGVMNLYILYVYILYEYI